jgi:cyclopropane fatty-acyl-phospholipid synthase-like methyltransferase
VNLSKYYDRDAIAREVTAGKHREIVGGKWDEIGMLQFEYLVAKTLQPEHRLLDIGCGCLRGGVHFIRYLAPANYFGIDVNQSLLDAGYNVELAQAGLQDRLPRENLICSGEFEFEKFGTKFHFAIAQSLFTHLPLNHIRHCLINLASVMEVGGVFLRHSLNYRHLRRSLSHLHIFRKILSPMGMLTHTIIGLWTCPMRRRAYRGASE